MKRLLLIILLVNVLILSAEAQLRTKQIFGDHAILQRDTKIPVTGWGDANENVKITIAKKEYSGVADQDGKWVVNLPAMPAGGPYKIDLKTSKHTLAYEDIYFGDVWLCSGQSNMEWVLNNTDNAKEEIAHANDGLIRQFKVAHMNADTPKVDYPDGEWVVGSPSSAGSFTAVGYYFAKELRKSQNVPIGLLNSSWGGSRIEPWISKKTLDSAHPAYSYGTYVKDNNVKPKDVAQKMKAMFPGLTDKDAGLVDGKPVWTGTMDNSKWTKIDPVSLWEDQGFAGADGVAWYRTEFEGSKDMTIWLGAIDDNDMAWVNGHFIGETKGYNIGREYKISANHLKKGKNELLIRVHDTGGGGGLYHTEAKAEINGKPLSSYDWQIRFGAITSTKQLYNHVPNVIYNAMISPVIDFPVKGVIWYQGESNTRNLKEAYDYRYLLRTLVNEWREKWKQAELPFFYVSLANFRAPVDQPGTDGWAIIRESMTDVLELPQTGQAIITDIGEEKDIHPRNKSDVGYRLALPARNLVYNEDVVPGSPMYASHRVVGNHIAIEFKQQGDGIMLKDRYGYVKGFSIAGADKKFVWAQAKLENGKVVVWSESVPNPVAVRYAWETNPEDANLFSKDGLPVTPFRTDDWAF